MKHLLKVAICEDNMADAELLRNQLAQSIRARAVVVDIYLFTTGEALLKEFAANRFDIIFLDIWLDSVTGMTGIDVAHALRAEDSNCAIIFTTASTEFAVESYSVHALHYIIKPVTAEAIEDALSRCEKYISELSAEIITVTVDRKSRNIFLKDILYVEVNDKYCLIHTHQNTIAVRIPIDQLAQILPSPPFYRCHRGFVVNFNYVKRVERDFIMKNGNIVCIRQAELKRIKERYFAYLVEITRQTQS